jgi:hypothetical protein
MVQSPDHVVSKRSVEKWHRYVRLCSATIRSTAFLECRNISSIHSGLSATYLIAKVQRKPNSSATPLSNFDYHGDIDENISKRSSGGNL